MQRKARYFDTHSGRELTEAEALSDGNVLRDGVTMRTRMMAQDHAQRFRDGRELFDSGQVTITDGDGTLRTGNAPGWRISDSPINRQSLTEARTAYLDDLKNAWRKPAGAADAAPDEGDPHKRRVWEEADEDDDDDEIDPASDRPPFGSRDRRSVDEISAAHQRNMQRVCDSYARELSEAYKGKNK
jgi:hypothetical protein